MAAVEALAALFTRKTTVSLGSVVVIPLIVSVSPLPPDAIDELAASIGLPVVTHPRHAEMIAAPLEAVVDTVGAVIPVVARHHQATVFPFDDCAIKVQPLEMLQVYPLP